MRPRIRGLLHDHVDGSLAVKDVIGDLYRLAKKPFPFPSVEDWIASFKHETLVKWFGVITGVLQSREALEMLGYAYGKRRAQEGYKYVEAKFAPQYSVFGGLTLQQATDAMVTGLWQAERDFRIRILPCVCIGREAPPELGKEIAWTCLGYAGEVAMGLACDEAGHPPEKHLPAYRMLHGTVVRKDCHAGEWVSPEPAATYRQRLLQNVRTAVYELKVDRLGHAIPLCDDGYLVSHCAHHGIGLAGCPAAYVAAGLIGDIRELHIPELLDAGVRYTINPDDDLFLPPMPQVVAACATSWAGFTEGHWQQLAGNVFASAFAKDADKYLETEPD